MQDESRENKCHVIVGSGPAGLFLCNKVLERDDIILIERGKSLSEENNKKKHNYFDFIVRTYLSIRNYGALSPSRTFDRLNSTVGRNDLTPFLLKLVQ